MVHSLWFPMVLAARGRMKQEWGLYMVILKNNEKKRDSSSGFLCCNDPGLK